jgi:hypothetical protein
MNRTAPTGGLLAPLRASLPLALLIATAALATGAQALAPASAAAAINQGEECDPNNPTADCESTNGGGGGSTEGSAGGDQIIGEAIYVEGTLPPSACGAFCLPSQVGGSHTGFLDRGGRDPRAPRARGRLARVGEVAKGKRTVPSKDECERLKDGRLELPADAKTRELNAREAGLWKEMAEIRNRAVEAGSERELKLAEMRRLTKAANSDAGRKRLLEAEIANLKQEVAALDYQNNALFDEYTATIARREHAQALAAAEKKAQLAKCRGLNR